jgi:hypothetical protein
VSQLKLIRDLIADDSYASTFQTMGQYRTSLLKNADALVRRFAMTYCSQCGNELGPGNSGVSHCDEHVPSHKEAS